MADQDVPLVVFDLASVETYILVRALSDVAVEADGALWCPLISHPAPLDLDIEAAQAYATRLQLPFVRPRRHPAPVPRAMRLAALAAARGHGAIFTVRATRLAWSIGADLDRLGGDAGLRDGDMDDDAEEYLRLMMDEIGVDVPDARVAAEEGSDWDVELDLIARTLSELGAHSAPALRLRGVFYTGQAAIASALAGS